MTGSRSWSFLSVRRVSVWSRSSVVRGFSSFSFSCMLLIDFIVVLCNCLVVLCCYVSVCYLHICFQELLLLLLLILLLQLRGGLLRRPQGLPRGPLWRPRGSHLGLPRLGSAQVRAYDDRA